MKVQRRFLKDASSKKGWDEAKKKCRLDDEEVWMAQRLGKTPLDMMRMIPSASEIWKDPAALYIRRLYSKRFGNECEREARAGRRETDERFRAKRKAAFNKENPS